MMVSRGAACGSEGKLGARVPVQLCPGDLQESRQWLLSALPDAGRAPRMAVETKGSCVFKQLSKVWFLQTGFYWSWSACPHSM